MQLSRKPSLLEIRLLEILIKKSTKPIPENWQKELLVCPMNDGGMGSLRLFPQGQIIENRTMGEQASDFQFSDRDGVEVIATLNLDQDGNLYELDIWKTNFERLLDLPYFNR